MNERRMEEEEAQRLLALRSIMAATQALSEDHGNSASPRSDETKENENERLRLLQLREALDSQQKGVRRSLSSQEPSVSRNGSSGVPRSSLSNGGSTISSSSLTTFNGANQDYDSFDDDRLTNSSMMSAGGASVFDRLYSQRKPRSSTGSVDRREFHPKIDPKSRQIATSQGERISLYERALQQRYRLETSREVSERQAREDRSRSKLSQSSQELAWNKLKREIEQLFAARIQANQPEGQGLPADALLALNRDEFADVLRHLNLHEVVDELFKLLAREETTVGLEAFSTFIKCVSFPSKNEDDEKPEDKLDPEFLARTKRLLIGRKAVPSTASLERVFREVAAETPFSPQITERSRILDEKRFLKMGIDPSLPRSEKIHAELKVKAERKERTRMRIAKQELTECTFRPKTTKFAQNLVRTTDIVPVQATENDGYKSLDVGSRLFRDSIDRKNRLAAKSIDRMNRQLSDIAAECTFRPQTNVGRKTSVSSSSQAIITLESAHRLRAYENSVERLRTWREKHVVEEDMLDVAKMPQPQRDRNSRPQLIRDSKPVVFEAEVNLPNGDIKQIQVRQGDNLKRVAYVFARRYDLNQQAEAALAESLAEGMRNMYEENEEEALEAPVTAQRDHFEESLNSTDMLEEESAFMIDVMVRPGETYTLTLTQDDDPEQLANDFAAQVGMDDDARDTLIRSLLGIQLQS